MLLQRQDLVRRRFPVAIVGLSAVCLAALGVLSVGQVATLTRTRVEGAALDLVRLRAQEIASFFAERSRVANTMLDNPALRRYFEGYHEFRQPLAADPAYADVNAFFRSIVASDPTITSAFFAVASTGEYFWNQGRVEREGYDTRQRWWWTESLGRGKAYVTTPGVDAGTGQTLVTVQKPVYRDSGELLGVGGIDVAVDTLGSVVREIRLDGQGDAFLVDETGHLIYFPGIRRGPGEPGRRVLVPLTEVDSRDPGNRGFDSLAKAVARGLPGLAEVVWQGSTRIVIHAPVRTDAPELRWALALMLPEDVITSAIVRTQVLTALAILAAVAAIAGVTLLVTRRIDVQLMDEERRRAAALAEANNRLREADRMKSQFLATMSHELRTPLNSVIGFAQVLRARLEGQVSPGYLHFLDNIQSSGEHLLTMINDILDLSKVEAGRLELHPERFAPRAVVDGVCAIVHGMAAKRRVKIQVEVPETLPELEADAVRFKQVVFNLLSNAVKFSPEGGSVQVVARTVPAATSPLGEEALELDVIDHGIGIAPADQELIFEAFRQADSSQVRQQEGTGLGLTLVRRLVGLHRGQVTVASALGHGSTFTVILPLRFLGVVGGGDSGVFAAVPAEGAPVLVVEDDTEAFENLRSLLAPAGFRVTRSADGTDTLELARRVKPVLIVLDVILPTTDGWTILRQLREAPDVARIPVVIVSVQANHELGLALGADAYLTKPLDRASFLARISELVPPAGPTNARLLVIDDDPKVHELLEASLGQAGYHLVHARSGDEGLALARQAPPDLILLDLLMEGSDGFTVAAALRSDERTRGVPVVVLTALDLSHADRKRLKGSIEALVRKADGTATGLLPVLREVLGRQQHRS